MLLCEFIGSNCMQGDNADEMAIFSGDGHRHSRLKLLFFQLWKVAETRIVEGRLFQNDWLEGRTNPACNAFAQSQLDFTHSFFILLVCVRNRGPPLFFILPLKNYRVP